MNPALRLLAACCLLPSAILLHSEPAPESRQTELLFFFDAEDYTHPRPANALKDLLQLHREFDIKVHVALVGHLARQIKQWGMKELIDELRHHLVGTQSAYHTRHPNVLERADEADYDLALRQVAEEELPALQEIASLTGKPCLFAVPPGASMSYAAMSLYAENGIRFYCDTVVNDERGGDWHLLNLRHLPYCYAFGLEDLIPTADSEPAELPEARWRDILERLAAQPRALLFLHPCSAVTTEFWDRINFYPDNLAPFGQWRIPRQRAPAQTAVYYARIRELLRRLRADRRFLFPTLEDKLAAQKPRVPIRLQDAPRIARHLQHGLYPVQTPSWSLADLFWGAVHHLRGKEGDFFPGRYSAFRTEPVWSREPLTLSADEIKAAARGLEVGNFLPPSIRLGSKAIGPGDFLRAAWTLLATERERVELEPSDPLAAVRLFPDLEHFHPRGKWLFWARFQDAWCSNRLRWAVWTARQE